MITAITTSFSFRLDENSDLIDERRLLHNFVAYLKLVLDRESYIRHIPLGVCEESKQADG